MIDGQLSPTPERASLLYAATAVKLTFVNGAALKDPVGLFNANLEGNVRRAIGIRGGDRLDAKALQALIRAAVALNIERANARPRKGPTRA